MKQLCIVIDLVIDTKCVLQLHETWTLLLASPSTSGQKSISFGYHITIKRVDKGCLEVWAPYRGNHALCWQSFVTMCA